MKKWYKNTFNQKKLSDKDKISLIGRLHDLLTHGFTISEAFHFIIKQYNIPEQYKAELLAYIAEGATCNQLLSQLKYPKPTIMLVLFTEKFSDLNECLPHIQDYLKRNYEVKLYLLKALQYPVILCSIFFLMLTILNHTVIPEFETLFATMDVTRSPFQHLLTYSIMVLPKFISIFFISIFLILIIMRKIIQRLPINKQIRLLSKLPIFHHYYRLYKTYQFASEFALFYKHGVTLHHIVNLYQQQEDLYLNYLASVIAIHTTKGDKLDQILSRVPCIETELITFIQQGERSGKLGIELQLYSTIIIDKIQNRFQQQIRFIQPTIFLILAILIVALYAVIMLPMFDLMQTLK
ncbi:competence type IV pilus assembly protein ComGB [Staphylococcus arlettae]|uniref:competence type IV pilus assembly protein ComGB n=1 Tax=Staphylococcus arlettae TaxID=29378 RepID=UPI0021D23ADD|nr:competence type IV pilus assembly protein ComGB [Staphylococcus arlettae]UXU48713.1 type II secretion system F family protein [Staphylococcus arlettae]